jgi:hypothetical protein
MTVRQRQHPAWPAEGTQVILRAPHPWKGYTGAVTLEGALPGCIVVELHELRGVRAGVIEPGHIRVLPASERRS